MPRISTDNYDTVASWNGSQDLFVVEQPDGTKVATPAMVKQFIEAGDFAATGEITDGHGNMLKDMAKSVDVDIEIGDLSQTGLTGDSVAEQLSNASNQIATINTTLNKKLTLVEHKKTTTGNSVTLDTQLVDSADYLLSMAAPVTATARRLRLSIVSIVNNYLNEAGFGNSSSTVFTFTVSNRKITITSEDVRYGIEASLIKLS